MMKWLKIGPKITRLETYHSSMPLQWFVEDLSYFLQKLPLDNFFLSFRGYIQKLTVFERDFSR